MESMQMRSVTGSFPKVQQFSTREEVFSVNFLRILDKYFANW